MTVHQFNSNNERMKNGPILLESMLINNRMYQQSTICNTNGPLPQQQLVARASGLPQGEQSYIENILRLNIGNQEFSIFHLNMQLKRL